MGTNEIYTMPCTGEKAPEFKAISKQGEILMNYIEH